MKVITENHNKNARRKRVNRGRFAKKMRQLRREILRK